MLKNSLYVGVALMAAFLIRVASVQLSADRPAIEEDEVEVQITPRKVKKRKPASVDVPKPKMQPQRERVERPRMVQHFEPRAEEPVEEEKMVVGGGQEEVYSGAPISVGSYSADASYVPSSRSGGGSRSVATGSRVGSVSNAPTSSGSTSGKSSGGSITGGGLGLTGSMSFSQGGWGPTPTVTTGSTSSGSTSGSTSGTSGTTTAGTTGSTTSDSTSGTSSSGSSSGSGSGTSSSGSSGSGTSTGTTGTTGTSGTTGSTAGTTTGGTTTSGTTTTGGTTTSGTTTSGSGGVAGGWVTVAGASAGATSGSSTGTTTSGAGGAGGTTGTPPTSLTCSAVSAGGSYSNPVSVTLSCDGPADIYYCITNGPCNPGPVCDPTSGGTPYSSPIAIGATDGTSCLSFYGESTGTVLDSPIQDENYVVSNTFPDLEVAHEQTWYQTTELAKISIASNDFGQTGYGVGVINTRSHDPGPADLNMTCAEIVETTYVSYPAPQPFDILAWFVTAGVSSSDQVDVPLIFADAAPDLDYGDNFITTYIKNTNNAAPLYSCQTTKVHLEDFDYFQADSSHGEAGTQYVREFSGGFTAYGFFEPTINDPISRGPAGSSSEDSSGQRLESGLFSIFY